jgi:hypothetical protein
VDKSVEKPGSSTLSARSVSRHIQIGQKLFEMAINQTKSMGYVSIWNCLLSVVANIAGQLARDVRKSLILGRPVNP